MAASRNVPLISIKDRKEGSVRLGELIKLKTAIAIGIKVISQPFIIFLVVFHIFCVFSLFAFDLSFEYNLATTQAKGNVVNQLIEKALKDNQIENIEA